MHPDAPWNLILDKPDQNQVTNWKTIRVTRFRDLETAFQWIEHTFDITPVRA